MNNLFDAIAEHLIRNGEDGEVVSTQLAQALKKQINEGLGKQDDKGLTVEFLRLTKRV